MIFVTVGSQLPFDRLVLAVAAWAEGAGRASEIVAQVGTGGARPEGISCSEALDPEAFDRHIERAELVVGHAGTGTIMAALMANKPVVCLARRVGLGETRNDHQVATIERLAGNPLVFGAQDEGDIGASIERALAAESRSQGGGAPISSTASPELIARVSAFLERHIKPSK